MNDAEFAKVAAAWAWCQANPDKLWRTKEGGGQYGIPLPECGGLYYRDVWILALRARLADDLSRPPLTWAQIGEATWGYSGGYTALLAKRALAKLMADDRAA
jgi:hypothetical protein